METNLEYLKRWEEIANATDLIQVLTRHFAYLADSPGYDRLLESIMQKVLNVRIEEDSLQILFRNNFLLKASAPASIEKFTTWPECFQRLIIVHQLIEFGDSKNRNVNWEFILGDHGSFLDEFIDEEFENSESPLVDASDWWIYHPKEKNEQGQPILYFVSHESGKVKESFPHNVGSLFLRRLADRLKIDFSPKSKEDRFGKLTFLRKITLPFCILKAESIGENKIGAILSQGDQRFFGILDTSNMEDIKFFGKTEFPSLKGNFNMKVSGSKAILYNRRTSLFNPLVWIDLDDLSSPKVGGIIDEKGTDVAAIYQDQVVYKTAQLFRHDLSMGEKKSFKSIIRARELAIDENFIVVQNQEETQVLNFQYDLISQGKADSGYPKSILFSEFRLIVCLDDSLQILSFLNKKLEKQKIPILKGHSCRQPHFISGSSLWFLTIFKDSGKEQYNLVRLNPGREESKVMIFPLPDHLEYDESAIEIVSNELRIYLSNQCFVYILEGV
ncbi:hypothetical protein LEP1GSC039_0207 [Leptospira santarosai str. 2000027870]|uniref:hypothetical protein n=1 Tax=Leptospira santarosai TaxID=28183 RepID=UPI0002BF6C6E|nr:hypothetical protein [Leptospira santarosai]EMM85173.1 hypothetical protein LEP1GSC039_0207 [Leptospira santarosai str. 2000027870]